MLAQSRPELRVARDHGADERVNLIPTLTASQNVEVALAPAGKTAAERRETVQGLFESVGLGERADHVPSKLS
jgi:putative ABC transport system ATP-binding protein